MGRGTFLGALCWGQTFCSISSGSDLYDDGDAQAPCEGDFPFGFAVLQGGEAVRLGRPRGGTAYCDRAHRDSVPFALPSKPIQVWVLVFAPC